MSRNYRSWSLRLLGAILIGVGAATLVGEEPKTAEKPPEAPKESLSDMRRLGPEGDVRVTLTLANLASADALQFVSKLLDHAEMPMRFRGAALAEQAITQMASPDQLKLIEIAEKVIRASKDFGVQDGLLTALRKAHPAQPAATEALRRIAADESLVWEVRETAMDALVVPGPRTSGPMNPHRPYAPSQTPPIAEQEPPSAAPAQETQSAPAVPAQETPPEPALTP